MTAICTDAVTDVICRLLGCYHRDMSPETEKVIEHAKAKRAKKGCDWIVANDVSPATGVMGGDDNTVHIISANDTETWPKLAKGEVAHRLAAKIAAHFKGARA